MSRAVIKPLVRGLFLPAIHCLSLPMLLFAAGPSPNSRGELKERVDLIELNHFYDDLGRHAFDQVIFYEWSPDFRRFHVIAWSLVEGDLQRLPSRVPGSDDTRVQWFDRDARVNRQVQAKLYRETWSQQDPERANKRLIDEKYRLSLMRVPNRDLR